MRLSHAARLDRIVRTRAAHRRERIPGVDFSRLAPEECARCAQLLRRSVVDPASLTPAEIDELVALKQRANVIGPEGELTPEVAAYARRRGWLP